MGMFNQMKMAAGILKNMSPEERASLMEQAKSSQGMLEDTVRKIVREEIKNGDFVSKDEVEKLIKKHIR